MTDQQFAQIMGKLADISWHVHFFGLWILVMVIIAIFADRGK